MTLFYDFYWGNTHNMENCRALQALAGRFIKTSLKVEERANENPNGVHVKGGGFRGGHSGGRVIPINCYNCDEIGHISTNCPLPRRPRCGYYRATWHATKECSDLLEKWEARARERNANLVSSDPRKTLSSKLPGRTRCLFTSLYSGDCTVPSLREDQLGPVRHGPVLPHA